MPDLAPGTTVDGAFSVIRKLGAGGMGGVYLVRDNALRRTFALKTISGIPRGVGLNVAMERFAREAMLAAQLRHPAIVPVYRYGTDAANDIAYYTMEDYLLTPAEVGRLCRDILHCALPMGRVEDGKANPLTLANALAGNRALGEGVAIRLALQIIPALQAAHAFTPPIVHRDLKPSNLIFDRDGTLRLSDFGIARPLPEAPYADDSGDAAAADASFAPLTLPDGPVPGTPSYAAPELVAGVAPTPSADYYSLGMVLYRMLTGGLPKRGRNALPTETAKCVSPLWQPLLDRLLESDPTKRLADGAKVAAKLREIGESIARPFWARTPVIVAIAAAAGVSVAATAFLWHARKAAEDMAVAEKIETIVHTNSVKLSKFEHIQLLCEIIDEDFADASEEIREGYSSATGKMTSNLLDEAASDFMALLKLLRDDTGSSGPAADFRMMQVLQGAAICQTLSGKFADADQNHREAIEICRRLAEANPRRYGAFLGKAMSDYAYMLNHAERHEAALYMFRDALETWRANTDGTSQDSVMQELLMLSSIGAIEMRLDHYDQGIAVLGEAIAILEPICAEDDAPLRERVMLADDLAKVGVMHQFSGRFVEAADFFERSYKAFETLRAVQGNAQIKDQIAAGYHCLHCLWQGGDAEGAIKFGNHFANLMRGLAKTEDDPYFMANLDVVLRGLVKINAMAGHQEAAEALFRELDALAPSAHPSQEEP